MVKNINSSILVTGANGFIGSALCQELINSNYMVSTVVRDISKTTTLKTTNFIIKDLDGNTDFINALNGIDVVVHLAARAHILSEHLQNPLQAFRKVNVDATVNLAEQAAIAGVRKFIYLSSIGVYGSNPGRVISETSQFSPSEDYAISKLEAEFALREVERTTKMKVVIIRPPLVYGPNNPGNFLRLLKLSASGMPLPFGNVKNKRSLIYIGNLVSFIMQCIRSSSSDGKSFIVTDGEDISTPELIRKLSMYMGNNIIIFNFPYVVLQRVANLIKVEAALSKLCGTYQADASYALNVTSWIPPYTLDKGLENTANWYRNNKYVIK